MANIQIDSRYIPFFEQLQEVFKSHDILLSERSTGLLRLATEAWFEDPELAKSLSVPQVQQELIVKQIIAAAILDPHVVRARLRHEQVNFGSMLVALGAAGRRILRPFQDKGF